ncbi:MAG TPA: hypothetical protein VEU96_11075 [Bryobacteraceae bacterium]|nr:hypothetical protein [Bryobacteraceae bacterium]
MSNKAGLYLFVLIASLGAGSSCVNGQSWYADRELANDLTKNGTCVEQDRATLCFESGILQPDEVTAFSELVNRGIIDIEAYLGASRLAGRKIRYFISSKIDISHSTYRSIYLPMTRVQRRIAPYLHETTHLVAPCDACPMWFSEGLASYVQSYVSEHTGGYDGGIFSRRGNRGIDQDARRWVASERGQAVIPFIGMPGEPPSISYDRSNVAAPFYVMAQSFVQFLLERNTPEQARAVIAAKNFDADLQTITGKSAAEWKELWLAELRK